MELPSIVDKICCINLAKRLDRRTHMTTQFKTLKWDVTFIPGIQASKSANVKKIRRNQIGCLESHCSIYDMCIENRLEKCCILEDDVTIFPSHKEHLDHFNEIPEDWGVIYLGWEHMANRTTYQKITDVCYRITQAHGTHAYIINEKFYNLSPIIKTKPYAIDLVLSEYSHTIPMYGISLDLDHKLKTLHRNRTAIGPFQQDHRLFSSDIVG